MNDVSFLKQHVNIVSGNYEILLIKEQLFRFCLYKHIQC